MRRSERSLLDRPDAKRRAIVRLAAGRVAYRPASSPARQAGEEAGAFSRQGRRLQS